MRSESCDIFCTVVDNYGDIGVCWRLARQLSNEHGLTVRLWVDDLRSFGKLCPELDMGLDEQRCRGVQLRHWTSDFPAVEPADLVIEAFACRLPQTYIEAMSARDPKPVWLNLEYLSAEDWVEGCHKLPSPHPTLPLIKYFFFPGFTEKTGGLLLERDLLARRDAFQSDAGMQQRYWRSLGVPQRVEGELRVSMFSYENEAMEALLDCWEEGDKLVTCLLPEGRSLPQVAAYFGMQAGKAGDIWQRGNLRVHVLPFVEQERYDELLWACDVNFVRGEDSCVRAQWAAKSFIWQIYPQHDGVHLVKLEALRLRYTVGLPPAAAQAVKDLWLAWNGGQGIAGAWLQFVQQRKTLAAHGVVWAQRLAGNNISLNLLDFFRDAH
ncbi:elongation factor P maturation arginine rhamnosyltransferase EarP [Sideroxydans sp. CL21]|uniref:elongation factor P maturation arginine rhamnosyltransferase EarP n=1 Tax=Sideroxydans sp. CL21 TaxID=2600596 RepID=UPI0024BD2D4B|nr:elongation factor P maturation arginine rhamnosyltransferase EarP [Sideroxydans sp. CL21]